MKGILPILTGVALGLIAASGCARKEDANKPTFNTQPTAATAAPPGTEPGENLVQNAVTSIEVHTSLAAKIRQRVDLFGHELIGSGTYWQQGRGADRRLRLELKIEVDDRVSSLQQVCDGNDLWVHQDLTGKPTLGRIDLRRVRNALVRRNGEKVSPPTAVWLSLGGLPKLLEGLNESFYFTTVKPVTLDGLAMWSIDGRWETKKLAEMLPDQKDQILAGQPANLNKLADHVPRRVVLLIGQDDLFPYRIEYWGRNPRAKKKAANQEKLILVMELFEVQFEAPVDPRQFTYSPGDQPVEDQTIDYLKRHGLDDERADTTRAGRGVAPRLR